MTLKHPRPPHIALKIHVHCAIIMENEIIYFCKIVKKQAQRRAAAGRFRHKSQGEFSARGRIFPHDAQNGFLLFSSLSWEKTH